MRSPLTNPPGVFTQVPFQTCNLVPTCDALVEPFFCDSLVDFLTRGIVFIYKFFFVVV